MTRQKYTVRILDNFHFMDKSAEYNSGSFDTYDEAVARCKSIIDDFLESAYKPGNTAEQLYDMFMMFGESPLISGPKPGDFNEGRYTKERCQIISKLGRSRMHKFIRDIDSE